MNKDARFVYRGKPKEYCSYLRKVLLKFGFYFENVHAGLGNIRFQNLPDGGARISLGSSGMLKVGRTVDCTQYPLQFKDGSILTIGQTLGYDQGNCWVIESVIRFAKLNPDQTVRYLFHYDSVMDIPHHPDHHLQFEFHPDERTPRFSLRAYEDLDTILHMIVRDQIVS